MTLSFIPWKKLVEIGLDFISANLLPKVKVNENIHAFFGLVLDFAAALVGVLTDQDPNNQVQIRQIFLAKIEALLSTLLAGVIDLVKDPTSKQRISAILVQALEKLS